MNRIPITYWTAEQDRDLIRLANEGKPAWAIGEAIGRSATAVRIRRRMLDCAPGLKGQEGPAPLSERVVQLRATIEQAVRNRRAKKYIRELRKGYIVLRARERGL